MDNAIDVAKYIASKYHEIFNENIDEMKLHKLLYFAERESFALLGRPIFEFNFEAWKYGPVCIDVRNDTELREMLKSKALIQYTNKISDDALYVIDRMIDVYGRYETSKLIELSHEDISWQNAIAGLKADEKGNAPIKLEDVKKDALKVRPYDTLYDMYYDEFDTMFKERVL